MYCSWVPYIHSYQYIPKEYYNNLKIDNNYIKSSNNYIINLLNIPNNDKKLYKLNIQKIKGDKTKNIEIFVEINMAYLEYLVNNGIEIPYRQQLFKIIRKNSDNKFDSSSLINKIINNAKISNNINNCFRNKLKFIKHDYQINNLTWMINLEKSIANKTINFINPDIIQAGNIFLDLNLERFYLKDSIKKCNHYITFKGGALIDSHYTGRKETILDLSKTNPCPNYKEKELFEDIYLKSSSNLIICGTQQSILWKNIFEKNNIKYVQIINKSTFEKTKYSDILESQFVIITTKFLTSNIFKSKWNIHQTRGQSIKSAIKSFNIENIRNPNIYNKKSPLPNLIYWYRVFYFESCENIIKDQNLYDYINTINSRFKWCIESIPFKENGNLRDMMKLLTVNNSFTDYKGIGNYVVDNLFMSNDLYKVNKENNVVIDIKSYWLDFSEKELYIYKKYLEILNDEKNIFFRKLCNCIQINEPNNLTNLKTSDDIHDCMVTNNLEDLKKLKKKKSDINIQIENLNKNFNSDFNKKYYEKIIDNKKNLTLNLNIIEKQIEKKKSEIIFFKKVLNGIKNEEIEDCVVCFSPIKSDNLAITSCGHVFCSECICKSIEFSNKCPNCRNEINQNDIYWLKKKNEINHNFLINKYGTKISKLIEIVNNSKNKNVMIVSQYDDILEKLKNLLKYLNFKVFDPNNIDKKQNIVLENIKTYKKSLININIIIFLDPIYNHQYYQKSIENNIINLETSSLNKVKSENKSKENIQIYKLFIKKSIEEKIERNEIIF